MMTLDRGNPVSAMESALRDLADCAESFHAGAGRWEFRYQHIPVSASMDDNWLWLRAPFAGGHFHGMAIPRAAWEILGRNSLLHGAAKLVIPPDASHVQASVELPMDRGADDGEMSLPSRIRQALVDLKAATARPRGRVRETLAAAEESAPDLVALCAAAGWPCLLRGDKSVTVRLDSNRCVVHAVLRPADPHAAVPLPLPGNAAALSAASRQAIGAMLLQLGGTLRLVRPCVTRGPAGETLLLDAWLGVAPQPRHLDDALSALSVAGGMAAREVVLLSNEQVARRYLAARGWSAR